MNRSPLWRAFASGSSFPFRLLQALIFGGGVLFLATAGVLPLAWPQQTAVALVLVLLASGLQRGSSQLTTLTIVLLSVFASFRYGFWRLATVIDFFRRPAPYATSHIAPLDGFFVVLLLAAEFYAFGSLLLGYVQTLWPLHRAPVPLPEDVELWPAVDLLIPTVDEPLSLVKYTVLAALQIDWPAAKLRVWILDDGAREEFRSFAEAAGVGYIARVDSAHAKAGNINHALPQMKAPFVAIFDCDHVPTRSFLQITMGWFGRDSKLGMLQTPQHFYSPDPFARNLGRSRRTPGEDELFYRVVQDGNDFWNAAIFCGSCAVMRRTALDEVGGVAVETVAEDAHTSLRMQRSGWSTAYINIPQAAGLATARLSSYVRQRVRWARGMVQILRLENPLFGRGLSAAQRVCYFNAMTHFLFALPRLIFLTAPLIFLVLGRTNLPGYWPLILAYAVPHLALATLAHARIAGRHRQAFWSEIYETVLAPFLLLPTLLAVLRPRSGRFHVTEKSGVVGHSFFDGRRAWPLVLLLLMNVVGLVCAVPRWFRFPLVPVTRAHSFWLNVPAHMYDRGDAGAIVLNVLWASFNVVILCVAAAVAWERQQQREAPRVAVAMPATVVLTGGESVAAWTEDLSRGGVLLKTESRISARFGDSVQLLFTVAGGEVALRARLIDLEGDRLRVRFESLTMEEEEVLATLLYARADAWLERGGESGREAKAERALVSLARIVGLAIRVAGSVIFGRRAGRREPASGKLFTTLGKLVLLVCMFGVGASLRDGNAQAGAQVAMRRTEGASGRFSVGRGFSVEGVAASLDLRLHGWKEESIETRMQWLRRRAFPAWRWQFRRLRRSLGSAWAAGVRRSDAVPGSRLGGGFLWMPVRAQMLMSEFSWLIALLAAMFCWLMAIVLRARLRRHARRRLQGIA